jgi:hypothetical protein
MARMLINQRIGRDLYGGRESGAVVPLEASRGAEVAWASIGQIWKLLLAFEQDETIGGENDFLWKKRQGHRGGPGARRAMSQLSKRAIRVIRDT